MALNHVFWISVFFQDNIIKKKLELFYSHICSCGVQEFRALWLGISALVGCVLSCQDIWKLEKVGWMGEISVFIPKSTGDVSLNTGMPGVLAWSGWYPCLSLKLGHWKVVAGRCSWYGRIRTWFTLSYQDCYFKLCGQCTHHFSRLVYMLFWKESEPMDLVFNFFPLWLIIFRRVVGLQSVTLKEPSW